MKTEDWDINEKSTWKPAPGKNGWGPADSIGTKPPGTKLSLEYRNSDGDPLGWVVQHGPTGDIRAVTMVDYTDGPMLWPFPTIEAAKNAVEYAASVGFTLVRSSEDNPARTLLQTLRQNGLKI